VKWIAPALMPFLISFSAMAYSQVPAQGTQARLVHDREFWLAIAKNHYAVPEGQQVFPLLYELSGYVGSKDSELRDDLGYSITTTWIKHQDIPTADLNSLMDEWCANLRVGIGESGNESVLKRSFSALSLVALAERDLTKPFLTEERYRRLLDDALAYLKDEHDLRGFDPQIGWIHATAHTADLLAALAMNSMFKPEDQPRVLTAITARLSSAHEIFTFGEQDRLSLVAARIVGRKDFDTAEFDKWLNATDTADQQTWKNSPPKLEMLQTYQNDTYMLRGLAVYLTMTPARPPVTTAQNEVLTILRER
jgi:Protein of unknown function (DUF2785)